MRKLLAILAGVALLAAAPFSQGASGIYVLSSWLVYSIAAMGLNLTLGYSGQISLAQASFMAIGAYATALLTMAGLHWLVAAVVSMGLCFIVGIALGYPALRVQHHFLGFITLAFATVIFLVTRNEEWLTGGVYGIIGIPRPHFGPFSAESGRSFYHFTLAVFLLALGAFAWIVRSPWGRAFKALRENPMRANSVGVDIRRITLLAFAIGAAYGGLSGALMAPLVQFVDNNSFSLLIAIKILLMVVVGGSGRLLGPVLGAALVVLLPEYLRFAEAYYLIIYGALIVILMVVNPGGLSALIERAADLFKRKPSGREEPNTYRAKEAQP